MTQNPTNALYWKKRHQDAADEALRSYKRWSALRDAVVIALEDLRCEHGSPNHDHKKPGYWDSNGRRCAACAAWDNLRSLVADKEDAKVDAALGGMIGLHRKVKAIAWIGREQVLIEGVFHEWSLNHEQYTDGPGHFPVAIVEASDGKVHLCQAENVQFLDAFRTVEVSCKTAI